MDAWREEIVKEDVGTSELEVILPPRDLGMRPARVVSFSNEAGGAALADAAIEVAPTDTGPWFAETLTETGIPTLAAGATAVYRMTRYDRFLRVCAQAAGAGCNLTVWLDAEPA